MCVHVRERAKARAQQCCSLGMFQTIFQEALDPSLCKHYTVKSAACPRRGTEDPGSVWGLCVNKDGLKTRTLGVGFQAVPNRIGCWLPPHRTRWVQTRLNWAALKT